MGLFWSHPQVGHRDTKRNRVSSTTDTKYERPLKVYKRKETSVAINNDSESDEERIGLGTESGSAGLSEKVSRNADSKKRHKFAIVVGYLGAAYQGMQRNPGALSIEGELEKALVAADLIPCNLEGNLRKIDWSRAARTDKGVSAAGQVVSAYLMVDYDSGVGEDLWKGINDKLPGDIRILGMYSVSNGFHAKNACDRRRYSYIFPSWILCCSKEEHEEMRKDSDYLNIMKQKVDDFNELLKLFIGTHHFHNFTVGQTSSDGTCQRYILEFFCSLPFLIGNESFLHVTVVGQSFLLHQIRKMIGLTIAVYKGWIPKEAFHVSLSKHHRIETPMAPSLGLFLDECLFERYNERILKYHSNSPAGEELAKIRERAEQFKQQVIYEYISCQEKSLHVMERWMYLVRTKHPVDVASIMAKYEELMNQEMMLNRKRKEYMLDYITPVFDPASIYGQHEAHFLADLEERLNRCEEALAPSSVSFYLRVPVESICIMGEITKSLQVPCIYMTKSNDIIWGVSVEEGDFGVSLYNSRLASTPLWTMSCVDFVEFSGRKFTVDYYFWCGWKVALEFFQSEEIQPKKISVLVDCSDSDRFGMEACYYCSAFVIFMKALKPRKSVSRREIAEILIHGMHSRSLNISSYEIYACLCSRTNHLLVFWPALETQKVEIEHLFVPHWFLEEMEWLKGYILDQDKYRQVKALWDDWLQKVRVASALEMKKKNLCWKARSKDGVALQAHSPGMLLWKDQRCEHSSQGTNQHIYSDADILWKTNPREIANILNISEEEFRWLFGEMDMEACLEWKWYLDEFRNQVKNIKCFLATWKEMMNKEDADVLEKKLFLERCLEKVESNQKLLEFWFRKLSFSWFATKDDCCAYGIHSNAIIEWKKRMERLSSELETKDVGSCSFHPSNGICFWYPHFIRFVRRFGNQRKVRKSARKYRLR